MESLDVAITDSFAKQSQFPGAKNGTLKEFATIRAGYEAAAVVVATLTVMEVGLAVWTGSEAAFLVYLGQSTGHLKPAITTSVPYYASEMAVADFQCMTANRILAKSTSNSTFAGTSWLGRGDGIL